MPQFSQQSIERLETCDQKLQRLFHEVIKYYDCTVLTGYRSNDEQALLYNQGKSKDKEGASKHNLRPSLAVDVTPYPIDWKDMKRFYHFVGFVKGIASQLGISLRTGADWDGDNDFNDQDFEQMRYSRS